MVSGVIQNCLSAVASLRHRLHQIPELGYEEFKTSALIRAELDRAGIGYLAGVEDAPTATIAWIGDGGKPCIALRADIDALPIAERTGLPYASEHPGRMHACGHDGHASILLGAALILKSIADQLPVCPKFIWQPAEEGGGGAERLCRAGVLDGRIGPKVQAIFALHGWPGLPLGTISTRPGPLMAATDNFTVTFVGQGCHAAFPHLGSDPIMAAAGAIVNLQQAISRDLDPTEPAVLTVSTINAGTAVNVIPEQASFTGTVRTLSDQARKLVEQSLRRRCEAVAAAGRCKVKITWERGYPPVINDSRLAGYVANIARLALGNDAFMPAARPTMGGEDFAFYLQHVPGCFFFLGLCPPQQTEYPMLHSDRFDFADAALEVGVRMFVELARNYST